uniref:Nudix hydrolase domain-containing protein n=1 Tax=Mandrillus leucophaeus TaxID=9568 RepID=A0A2K5YWB6_MANLE
MGLCSRPQTEGLQTTPGTASRCLWLGAAYRAGVFYSVVRRICNLMGAWRILGPHGYGRIHVLVAGNWVPPLCWLLAPPSMAVASSSGPAGQVRISPSLALKHSPEGFLIGPCLPRMLCLLMSSSHCLGSLITSTTPSPPGEYSLIREGMPCWWRGHRRAHQVGIRWERASHSPAYWRAGGSRVERVSRRVVEGPGGQQGDSADPVSTRRSGVGLTGSRQTMFYTEVTDAQRSGPGGGLAEEGELIEVVHLPLEGAQAFADNPDIPKTLGVIFGVSWFLSQVAPNLDLQ